jgi:hypothetical protein
MASHSPIHIAESPIYSPDSPSYTPVSPALVVDSDDDESATGGNDLMEIPLAPTTPLRPAPEAVVAPGAPKKEVHFAAAKRSRDEDEEGGAAKRSREDEEELPRAPSYYCRREYAEWVARVAGSDGRVNLVEVVAKRLEPKLAVGPKAEARLKWLAEAVDRMGRAETVGKDIECALAAAEDSSMAVANEFEHVVAFIQTLAAEGSAEAYEEVEDLMYEEAKAYRGTQTHQTKHEAFVMLQRLALLAGDLISVDLLVALATYHAHVVRMVGGHMVPVKLALWDALVDVDVEAFAAEVM